MSTPTTGLPTFAAWARDHVDEFYNHAITVITEDHYVTMPTPWGDIEIQTYLRDEATAFAAGFDVCREDTIDCGVAVGPCYDRETLIKHLRLICMRAKKIAERKARINAMTPTTA
jgi:hypothetical protein